MSVSVATQFYNLCGIKRDSANAFYHLNFVELHEMHFLYKNNNNPALGIPAIGIPFNALSFLYKMNVSFSHVQ